MRVTDKYVFFFSYRDMFSNHYRHNPFNLSKYPGVEFYTVEHFMMYSKAMLFGDVQTAGEIAETYSPQSAKALGRKVKGFNNDMWEEYRERVLIAGLVCKMAANADIRQAAKNHVGAGRRFVEASPYDAIYGVKLAETDPLIDDSRNWKGQNLLGKYWDAAVCLLVSPPQGSIE